MFRFVVVRYARNGYLLEYIESDKLVRQKEGQLESFLWKLRRGEDERIDRSATSLRLPSASIKGLSPEFRNGLLLVRLPSRLFLPLPSPRRLRPAERRR
jgi:hypothetical protein